jgi:hypothetical protein
MTVTIYSVNNKGKQEPVCKLALVRGMAVFKSGSKPYADFILGRSIDVDGEEITSQYGRKFLINLHRFYSGSRLRASTFEESNGKSATW